MKYRQFTFGFILTSIIILSGCASKLKQLENVARDWSMTIRASQIIPVYPLTEDLRPGDVFVVATPVNKQIEGFDKKGFLPLDQTIVRLTGYKEFASHIKFSEQYADSYFRSPYAAVSHPLPGSPDGISSGCVDSTESVPEGSGASQGNGPPPDVVCAPRAAFPSYSFEVSRSAGLGLALPIQGVPFALGIMGAEAANGTVNISDAYTYGVDGEAAYKAFKAWHNNSFIRNTLGAMVKQQNSEIYLRVVTRVYFARSLQVSLFNADAVSGDLALGAKPPLVNMSSVERRVVQESPQTSKPSQPPPETESNPAPESVEETGNAPPTQPLAGDNGLNLDTADSPGITNPDDIQTAEAINRKLPNVSFKFQQASRRSVSMTETFKRPVVIGYVGFDVRVNQYGDVSVPLPSFGVLNQDVDVDGFNIILGGSDDPVLAPMKALRAVSEGSDNKIKTICDRIAKKVGGSYKNEYQKRIDNKSKPYDAIVGANVHYLNVSPPELGKRRAILADAIMSSF